MAIGRKLCIFAIDMRKTTIILTLFAVIVILASCSGGKKKYKIGVSQCSEDIWREKQNAELRIAAYLHDNVELQFAAAYDSDERQVQQIDSLVKTGIDLLIVAPNQVATISPAIDRAYDKGIPVIVFERKTSSQKYTAFISADNYEMGSLMGEYIASRLKGQGNVIEIMGLKGSSPAIDRHKGFVDALKEFPDIKLVATLQGDWTEQSAYDAIKAYKEDLSNIDFIFGQNDRMAMGVRKALSDKGQLTANTHFCGIDGLPGKDGGISLVKDSLLDASYIYPTRGDQLLQLAIDILDGKPYDKEVHLMAALVTQENANVLSMENEEIARQSAYLDQLHTTADTYFQQLGTQRIVNILAIILVVLLLAFAVILYRYHLQKLRMQEERSRMAREQLDFYTQVSHELRTPLTLIEGPLTQLADTKDIREAGAEASGLFAIIQRNTHQLTQLINKMLDHQASISSESEGNKETETVVSEADTPSISPEAPAPNTENNETILIVDDNADIRAYLRTILQDKYQVNEAADGQQGLSLANEIVPDLIVSDVMMPVMNGLEFCQRVKSGIATSHIPVILLTARALSQHQIEGYESGADAYITKPFKAEVLTARISNLLKSRHQLRHLFSHDEPETKDDSKPQEADVQRPTEKEDTFLLKFRDFIEMNMADSDLSVETIGAELGLSRVQLYRKVKALTGLSPVELLRKTRLQKACEILKGSDKNVSEVAYEVGFSAPSYFTKCFKDEFGISPSDL